MLLWVILALSLLSASISPAFLKIQNLLNILWQSSFVGVIAVGLTFVMIAGGIDLSVGSLTAFIGGIIVLTINALNGWSFSIPVAILVGFGVGAVMGYLSGLLVTKGKIAPFIATLGTMSIFRSITLYLANGGEFRCVDWSYTAIGMGEIAHVPIPAFLFVGYGIITWVILHNTRFGRYVYAVGANERSARYAAIDVDRIRIFTYVLSGLSVAISAVIVSSMLNSVSSSTTGLGFELDAIAAAVIGGTSLSGGRGSIWGTILGTIVLSIISNMLVMLNVSVYLQGTVKGLVIIAAVLVQRLR
uniref:ABC transporter permease n=1 Tax=Candidatus Caldatribacterium saccharofermentans TaxID=1454753 RepID=A0A7V4TFW7_9BACT